MHKNKTLYICIIVLFLFYIKLILGKILKAYYEVKIGSLTTIFSPNNEY